MIISEDLKIKKIERKTFIERQLQSKAASFRLILLLIFVISSLITIYYLASMLVLYTFRSSAFNPNDYVNSDGGANLWDPVVLIITAYSSIGLIVAGSLAKVKELKRGGKAVAENLAARPVLYETPLSKERQLLNIVEELSIAAGIPVPEVYILDKEPSINAFAAGHCLKDAVIGVSNGALKYLTREEMQGVIAHELSHILNFDMKLNMRLTSWIHGLEYVYRSTEGGLTFDSSESRYSGGVRGPYNGMGNGTVHVKEQWPEPFATIFLLLHPFTILSGILRVLGFFGYHSGQFIKASFSYNRELLADASATQITRNPSSLAGALKKIGALKHGSEIKSKGAEEVCHMFFASAISKSKKSIAYLRRTHPPLLQRIIALEPEFDGDFSKVKLKESKAEIVFQKTNKKAALSSVNDLIFNSTNINNALGSPSWKNLLLSVAFLASMPEDLKSKIHEPHGAISAILALFLQKEDEKIYKEQIDLLAAKAPKGVVSEVVKIHELLSDTPRSSYLKILEMTIPTLKKLSKDQYLLFKNLLDQVAGKNTENQVFLFTLKAVLLNNLDNKYLTKETFFKPGYESSFKSISSVRPQVINLLSALALSTKEEGKGNAEILKAFNKGLSILKLEKFEKPLSDTKLCLDTLDKSLRILSHASYELRFDIVQACSETINFDKNRSSIELELLRAIAETLECPLPPFA